MDFDEEMSSLQIEDLGEYFFPNELTNDNWKGFSLGYGDEEKVSTTSTSTASTTTSAAMASALSKPIAINRPSQLRERSGSLSNSLGGGGISLGSMLHDPSLMVSPPMLAPTFSDMLKQTNGSLTAAALGFGQLGGDFSLTPTHSQASEASAGLTTSTTSTTATSSATSSRSKDDELMDLANFTLEGRFNRAPQVAPQVDKKPQPVLMQRPPLNPVNNMKVAPDGSNAAAVCKRIMDEDEDDDDDDDEDYGKRSSSGNSTPSTVFGSKRRFDMVETCSTGSCSTIATPNEDDRGFRKKSREKMRRQEVNVKFDELIDLLGLSNRVRKSAILQEAVSAIKSLKRERDEMRRDRDRLQQEVSKLATCLQYSHLGSVAAANAVAMSQAAHTNTHFQPLNPQAPLAPMNPHQMPGPGCFPIGGTSYTTPLAPAGGVSTSVATPIAPKVLKSADLKS